VLDLFLTVMTCRFHPSVNSVGTCPKCRKPVCSVCLPDANHPCRACLGYKHAQAVAAAAATTVSIFVGMINPIFGLIAIVGLFFSFRALFRHRTRVILGKAIPKDTSSPQIQANESAGEHFCSNCRLWSSESYCKQCGNKLV